MEALDPVTYPKVRIGARDIEVRFTAGSIIRLKKEHQVDLNQLQKLSGAEAIEQTCKLLAAGISHDPDSAKLSVQEIADQIDLASLKHYADAVTESLKKALPQGASDPKPTLQ